MEGAGRGAGNTAISIVNTIIRSTFFLRVAKMAFERVCEQKEGKNQATDERVVMGQEIKCGK